VADGEFKSAAGKGKLNIYVCERCKGHTVTRDMDDGVTPFMIACRATKACSGWMKSSFYRVFDQSMREDFQWYKPSKAARLTRSEIEHVNKGGLLLRPAIFKVENGKQ
jgi:hypothetical protein